MRLVDAYGGDDDRSMAADNTSGYNCRRVKGSDEVVRPRLRRCDRPQPGPEPLPDRVSVAPRRVVPFARSTVPQEQSCREGRSRSGDVVVRAFAAIGWEWGGTWAEPDFQHFSAAHEQ